MLLLVRSTADDQIHQGAPAACTRCAPNADTCSLFAQLRTDATTNRMLTHHERVYNKVVVAELSEIRIPDLGRLRGLGQLQGSSANCQATEKHVVYGIHG